MRHFARLGQRQAFHGHVVVRLFADDAVLFQGDQKTQFLFPEELRVRHPGVPAIGRHDARCQAPDEHLRDHLPAQVVFGLAFLFVYHPKVHWHAHALRVRLKERDQIDALDRASVQAAPEVTHQLGLALLAVGLV